MIYEDEEARLEFHKLAANLQVDLMKFEESMAEYGLIVQLIDIQPASDEEAAGLEIVIRVAN